MKQDRIELRASQIERERLQEAAFYSNQSLSAFLRQAALEKSENILRNRDNITLSDRDRDIFLDALENPPNANKALLEAVKSYKKIKDGISKPFVSKSNKITKKKKKF